MPTLNDILKTESQYQRGMENVMTRRKAWDTKAKELEGWLHEIAQHLNENSLYAPGYRVEEQFATKNDMLCNSWSAINFKSGHMPTGITYCDGRSCIQDSERGFVLSFSLGYSGKVFVYLTGHYIEGVSKPGTLPMANFKSADKLTKEVVFDLVNVAIDRAHQSSFVGWHEEHEIQEVEPIGFKLKDQGQKHEITEVARQPA